MYGKNQNVKEFNEVRLKELPGDLETIEAINNHPFKDGYNPPEGKHGQVLHTPFMKKLCLKDNARVMLTYNIDVSDGLSNGTTGVARGFQKTENGEIKYIWVHFDEENAGAKLRQKHRSLKHPFGSENVTPIAKCSFQYQLGKSERHDSAKAKVIQFPLTLAFAYTIHKSQGGTIRPPTALVIDIDTIFAQGQLYVALGRIQRLSQLFLQSKNSDDLRKLNGKIMTSQKTLKETRRIDNSALNHPSSDAHDFWMTSDRKHVKIASLNIR